MFKCRLSESLDMLQQHSCKIKLEKLNGTLSLRRLRSKTWNCDRVNWSTKMTTRACHFPSYKLPLFHHWVTFEGTENEISAMIAKDHEPSMSSRWFIHGSMGARHTEDHPVVTEDPIKVIKNVTIAIQHKSTFGWWHTIASTFKVLSSAFRQSLRTRVKGECDHSGCQTPPIN